MFHIPKTYIIEFYINITYCEREVFFSHPFLFISMNFFLHDKKKEEEKKNKSLKKVTLKLFASKAEQRQDMHS